MLTREEYEKTYIRMMDSVKENDEYKGKKSCRGVDCAKCPLCSSCNGCREMINAFKIIEVVEQWGKEHPIMTMEDKFIEVFGQRPTDENGNYCCPDNLGLNRVCGLNSCDECAKKFWKSEYEAPKGK